MTIYTVLMEGNTPIKNYTGLEDGKSG